MLGSGNSLDPHSVPCSQCCGPTDLGPPHRMLPGALGGHRPHLTWGSGRQSGRARMHVGAGSPGLVPPIHVAFCTSCALLVFTVQTQTQGPQQGAAAQPHA